MLGEEPVTSRWPSISVVIAAHNAATTIGPQVDAVLAQDYRGLWDVTVVDDGSTDRTRSAADRAAHGSARYRSIRQPVRRGPSSARNTGANATNGAVLAFTDGDDLVHPGWLSGLAAALADADLVGGSIDDLLLNPHSIRRRRPPHPTNQLPTALGSIPYALGTNLAIHRKAFEHIGGWNTTYTAGTDVELCLRANLAGLRIIHAPDAIVSYRMPTTRRRLATQNYRWGRADRRLAAAHDRIQLPRDSRAQITGTALRLLARQDSPLRVAAYVAGRLGFTGEAP